MKLLSTVFATMLAGQILMGSPARSILVVFAHPDDDVTIGPLLAHYARAKVEVRLVFATSGQEGVTAHAKIPAGEQLAAVREEEARQAARAYGIPEPFLLKEHDGSLAGMQRHNEVAGRLLEIVRQVRPWAIITFGPDGLTGHPDHRAISNLVTEIFQMWPAEGIDGYAPRKLYYVAYPQSKFAKPVPPFPGLVANVNDAFITTVVPCADGLGAAARAEQSYKSQHTPEIMKGLNDMMANVFEGRVYLRLAFHGTGQQPVAAEDDVFAGMPK
jgi:LmbE family N-acetylglucosaminyl deacetylase